MLKTATGETATQISKTKNNYRNSLFQQRLADLEQLTSSGFARISVLVPGGYLFLVVEGKSLFSALRLYIEYPHHLNSHLSPSSSQLLHQIVCLLLSSLHTRPPKSGIAAIKPRLGLLAFPFATSFAPRIAAYRTSQSPISWWPRRRASGLSRTKTARRCLPPSR